MAELDIDADGEPPLARMEDYTWRSARKEVACLAFVRPGMQKAKVTAAMLGADRRPAMAVGTAAVVVVGEVEYRLKMHKSVVGYHNLKLVAEAYTAGQVGNTSKLDGLEILSAA